MAVAPNGLIVVVWAPTGCCKSSFAVTAPKPCFVFDHDLGIYRARGIDAEADNMPEPTRNGKLVPFDGVKFKSYSGVPAWDREGLAINRKKRTLWDSFMQDYEVICEDQRVESMVIDTFTSLTATCNGACLADIQDTKKGREKLAEMEYAERNARMWNLLNGARACQKRLIIVYHEGDEYERHKVWDDKKQKEVMDSRRTGRKIMDGFKPNEVEQQCDVLLRMEVEEVTFRGKEVRRAPVAYVENNKICLDANGLRIVEPTYDKVLGTLQAMKG